jgi:hypothetical protein
MKTTNKVFEGDLYKDNSSVPIREKYQYTFRDIQNASQLKATLRNGEFAWPGGYQMYLITNDGQAMCFKCAIKNFRLVVSDWLSNCDTGWKIVGCEINYEDQDCICCNCNKQIPAAYSEK